MKNIFLIISLLILTISCQAQTYQLRTYGVEFPKDSYVKDINNELQDYTGTWKGTWNNKNFQVTFNKIMIYKSYLNERAYYNDILIGKFKVTDSNGLILFDNTNIPNNGAKINGSGFKKNTDNYLLNYIDEEICGMSGWIYINFIDATKTKLNWRFSDMTDVITSDCPYYNANPFPEPLPKNIVLTKQ